MRIVEDRAQRGLRLRVEAELQLGVGDGVEAGGVEGDVVALRERLHALGDLHRLVGVARIVLEPCEVVENLDSQRDIVETIGQLERGTIALAGRIPGAGAHQDLAQAEEVIGPHPLGHAVIEQVDSRDRVLPGARDVADEVEEHREQAMAARHEVSLSALGRPLVDLPDQLAARRVLALPAQDVGLDELGTSQRILVAERARPLLERHRRRVRGVRIGEWHHLEDVELNAQALHAMPGHRRHRRGVRGQSRSTGRCPRDDPELRRRCATRMPRHALTVFPAGERSRTG